MRTVRPKVGQQLHQDFEVRFASSTVWFQSVLLDSLPPSGRAGLLPQHSHTLLKGTPN